MNIDISTLNQLEAFTLTFIPTLKQGDVIYLYGDLGSGKTTFTQLLLKNLGYHNRVKSPTYAIYETYNIRNTQYVHMDLYRLSTPEELYYIGIDEIFNGKNIVVIEWPQRGKRCLPEASKELRFDLIDSNRRILNLHNT